MITYIRKNIKGYYVKYPNELDSTYWEGKIGSTYEDFRNNKWIRLSDEQVAFYNEHPGASIYQVINMELPEPVEHIRTLEDAKTEKLLAIDDYDNSSFVNGFDVVNGNDTITAWLTPALRANYRSSIDAAELVGLTELSLYIGEISVTLPTTTAKLMLAQIQLYADQCFIVTKQHKAAVEAMNSIGDVDNYDVTADYPLKLSFTID